MSFHQFNVKTLDGQDSNLDAFTGKVLLVVNVASKCGLTPQYKDLEALHQQHSANGFSVLGFPCNQFGGQEPGSAEEIRTFCSTTYGVTFPMFEKINVNGDAQHAIYEWLTAQDTSPDGAGDIKWNFAKFLIGKSGNVLARFDPSMSPTDPSITKAIDEALKQ